MRKLLLLFLTALLVVPGVVLAQSDTLSRADINRISNSVVLIIAIDSSGDPFASGSGTIVTPDGVIYTNRHVIEDGADFAIFMLDQLGEPAKLTYFATPTMIHPSVDFAVMQIDRDSSGRRLDPNGLNLPYITLSNAQPDIGDHIYVFGYPSLGDEHLVLTSGSITTIQNDTLNGERIPFWYQTDAQISPGNSGGLVVNGSGRMIGIPTQVRSEDRTLGRLGGILSVTAIRGALDSSQSVARPTVSPNETRTIPNNNTQGGGQMTITITSVEHNITQDNQVGMLIHASVEAIGYLNVPLRAAVFAFWEDGTPVIANNRAPAANRTTISNQLTVQQVITPTYDDTVWDDLWLFLPYNNLPDGKTGTFPAYVEAQIGVDGGEFTAFSDQVGFSYTYPTQQLIADLLSIDHNVEINGQLGMKVHSHLNALGYQGQPLRVALFVYWADGTPISGSSAPEENQTTSGYLTVQEVITPSYDNSDWSDFWFFLPYDYFPTGLQGTQDAFAEVEIGVDGEAFTSWSLTSDFSLNYN